MMRSTADVRDSGLYQIIFSAQHGTPTEREVWVVQRYKHGAPPEHKNQVTFERAS